MHKSYSLIILFNLVINYFFSLKHLQVYTNLTNKKNVVQILLIYKTDGVFDFL